MTHGSSLVLELENSYNMHGKATPAVLHNTKLLLKLYRKVVWRMEHSLNDMDEECLETGNKHLYETLDELSGIVSEFDTARLEGKLLGLLRSRSILHIIEKSLVMLKDYPDNGLRYYEILDKIYVSRFRYSEDEILSVLDISRSTYFKYKKAAIETLSVVL